MTAPAAQQDSADETFRGAKAVDERLRFDEAALAGWMADNVAGYAAPLTVRQFNGGQSNPTYRLDAAGGAYVLRRKPFGPLLPSAHAVDREFRVISALQRQGFPVARAHALCMDDGVIGAAFYVMDMVEGRVFWDAALPGLTPAQRRGVYEASIDTLAQLHSIDPQAAGLGDYGRPGNYFARQVDRWSKQYRAAQTREIPEAERLMAWLPRTVPEQERTAIVHGDYRLDNIIFDPGQPRVAAVLDWELSTLGDPLADFSYNLMNWALPHDGRSAIGGLDLEALGIPTIPEAIDRYCRAAGRDGLPNLDWYFAFNLFRLVGIIQGIAKRIEEGTASSAQASQMIKRIDPLAKAAWDFAVKAGA